MCNMTAEESTRYVWDHAYLSNTVLARRIGLEKETIRNKRYGYGSHFEETAGIAVEKLENFIEQAFAQMNLDDRPEFRKQLLEKFLEALNKHKEECR